MNRIFLLTGLLMLPAAASAQRPDFELRRDLREGGRFVLRNIVGDVRLEGTSGRTLEVRAIKREGRHGDPADVEIKTVEIDGGVAVCVYYPGQSSRFRDEDREDRNDRAREDDRAERRRAARERARAEREADDDDDEDDDRSRGRRHDDEHDEDVCQRNHRWSGNNRNDTSVEFLVRVPTGLRLDAKTVAGSVRGEGLRGELDVGTVSGDVRLADLEAGALEVRTVSGGIDLDRVRARDVSAETVSGDVNYAGDIDPRGSYDFKTLSGDVVVVVPRQPSAELSAVTFSGDFTSDFPTRTDGRKRRHRYNATWGDGGARIDLESFSGDISIRSAR
jgi:hypothetical protein